MGTFWRDGDDLPTPTPIRLPPLPARQARFGRPLRQEDGA